MRELMVHAYAHEHERMVKRDVLRPARGHDARAMPLCQWFWSFEVDLDLRKERESAQLLKD